MGGPEGKQNKQLMLERQVEMNIDLFTYLFICKPRLAMIKVTDVDK